MKVKVFYTKWMAKTIEVDDKFLPLLKQEEHDWRDIRDLYGELRDIGVDIMYEDYGAEEVDREFQGIDNEEGDYQIIEGD